MHLKIIDIDIEICINSCLRLICDIYLMYTLTYTPKMWQIYINSYIGIDTETSQPEGDTKNKHL